MHEKSWLYFALGAMTVVSLGAAANQIVPAAPSLALAISETGIRFPDGTFQAIAAPSDPRLGFYLTDAMTYTGATALTACATGFHMAQIWEILDPSALRYASDASGAKSTGDNGPIPAGWSGWIRTGWESLNSNSYSAGQVNCDFYSQATTGFGTTAQLSDGEWKVEASAAGSYNGWLGPWLSLKQACSSGQRVWCVEDSPGSGA